MPHYGTHYSNRGCILSLKKKMKFNFLKKTGIRSTFDYKRIRFQVDENGVHVGRDTKNWGNCGPNCQIPDRGMYLKIVSTGLMSFKLQHSKSYQS